jgi:hypothetical protein
MKMNTDDIMNVALSLSGLSSIPGDSGIFRPADNVKRILFGIDIAEDDLIHAKNRGYDLVIAHHPLDQTRFISVMPRHEELMIASGVSPSVAAAACREHMMPFKIWMSSLPANDAAEKITALANSLDIGLMNIHNPCDELGRQLLKVPVDRIGETGTVSDLMAAYREIPEMAASEEDIELVCGSPVSLIGRAVVIHAAGTNGGYAVANTLFDSGIKTVIYIHVRSNHRERLIKEGKGNLILTGHYCSDSLGINPLIDALENRSIVVDSCNKMIRIKR